MWQVSLCIIAILIEPQLAENKSWALVGNPLAHFYPCKGQENIHIPYESGRAPGEENQYILYIKEEFVKQSKVTLKFDSEATLTLFNPPSARISSDKDGDFTLRFFKKASSLNVDVRGPASGTIPYLQSVVINTQEYCQHPNTGYMDSIIEGYQNTAQTSLTVPDSTCGRRKIDYTELIVNGKPTKAGDWPWHAAIYRLDGAIIKYICGGSLISKSLILTAAHCATIRGVPVLPEILSVVLGKYNLIGGDTEIQEREVHQITVHENFETKKLNNDIALLKLRSEAVYSDYVQPACIWQVNAYKKLPPGQILGTVVGWGFDQTDKLSPTLQQASIPKVSESTCLKSNPVFFSKLLTKQKFCAGWNNGTSACNGDSGGSFTVFVPDTSGDASANATGSWHIRGIVSLSISRRDAAICDPYQYVLFTDIAKFSGWLTKHMNEN